MKIIGMATTAWLSLAACVSAQESEPRNATIPVDGATRVEVRAHAGSLKIEGLPGQTAVVVSGTARASSSSLLSGIRLVAERRGDVVYVQAVMPDERGLFSGFGSRWAALDLNITVPAGIAVSARDGSGAAEVRGTGPLTFVDGSGALLIENILGAVDVQDGSGELTIRNVAGPLNVQDGSGEILIEDVGHEVVVRDGSGGITIRRVGNVRIESAGSGGIQISEAAGNVYIGSAGSSRVSVRDVGGDLTVARGRTSRVSHQDVRGTVSLPRR